MEGTLLRKEYSLDNGKVAPSAWTVLAKRLGEECYLEEEKTKDKWLRGEYKGYLDWMEDTIKIHKEYGLRKEVVEALTDEAAFVEGAEELFHWLRQNDAITVLVTGGFKSLADKVQRRLKINHAFSACEYFYNEDGSVDFANLLPSDNEGKAAFMRQIIHEHGLGVSDCVFVGDGKNDIYLANEVGCSIAFNAQDELKKAATYCISQSRGNEDLTKIMDFFEI